MTCFFCVARRIAMGYPVSFIRSRVERGETGGG
jgi:hypothetical protein